MLIPVILSGGGGARLWPVSREAYPKPFIRMPDGISLLQKTLLRAANLPSVERIITVTNREYFFMTSDEYSAADVVARHQFILEPVARNTAAAIAMAALSAIEQDLDAVMLVLPADHIIGPQSAFSDAVEKAIRLAESGHLVTFGIKPDGPETGYGYIECGDEIDPGSCDVVRFVEKPQLEAASEYVASGRFLWNSGIFCFRATEILDNLGRLAPGLYQAVSDCWMTRRAASPIADISRIDFEEEAFRKIPEISIDYAVMERAACVAVVPCEFEWSDIGSWDAMSRLHPADAAGNRTVGDILMRESRNCYVQSESRVVAAIGVEDLIVVDTADALLVMHRNRAQQVKELAQHLKLTDHHSYLQHVTINRPWGTFTVLEEGVGFKIKRIVVKPGASLSLQMHQHRSEHWVVVAGAAYVVNGSQELTVGLNESTFIPAGNKHRLSNRGMEDLAIIEVQSGPYLGEDDITRFTDDYGRI